MNRTFLFLALLLLVSSFTNSTESSKVANTYFKGKIIGFNDQNFARALSDFPVLLVSVVSDHCHQCQSLSKAFQEAAHILSTRQSAGFSETGSHHLINWTGDLPTIQFGNLAEIETPKTFEKYNVEFVPQIWLFINGTRKEEYNFDDVFDLSSAEYIVNWVLQKFSDLPLLPTQKSDTKNTIMVFGCKTPAATSLKRCMVIDNHNQYHCLDNTRFHEKEYKQGDIIVYTHDDMIMQYGQSHFDGGICNWIRRVEDGYIRKLSPYSIHLMFAKLKKAFVLLTHLDEASQAAYQQFKDYSKSFYEDPSRSEQQKQSVIFVHSNITDSNLEEHVRFRSYIGVEDKDYPYPHLSMLSPLQNGGVKKYWNSTTKPAKVHQWMNQALKGELQTYIRGNFVKGEPSEAFETIGYKNIIEMLESQNYKPFTVYVYSKYEHNGLLELEDAIYDSKIPKQLADRFHKVSYEKSQLPPDFPLESFPQIISFDEHKKPEYMRVPHTLENIMAWVKQKMYLYEPNVDELIKKEQEEKTKKKGEKGKQDHEKDEGERVADKVAEKKPAAVDL